MSQCIRCDQMTTCAANAICDACVIVDRAILANIPPLVRSCAEPQPFSQGLDYQADPPPPIPPQAMERQGSPVTHE